MSDSLVVVRNDLHEMCLTHFNEPMIYNTEIVRVIGYGEDDVDAYIIARRVNGNYHTGKFGSIIWISCVGGYHFLNRLKGQGYVLAHNGEEWDDLFRLNNTLKYSGCPEEETFIVEINKDPEFEKYD